MKTISINLYKLNELSAEAKQNAISKLSDINIDFDWWDCIYEDASQAGLTITSFDLGRSNYINTGMDDANRTAKLITENHGEQCDTFIASTLFLKDQSLLVGKYSNGKDLNIVSEDNEKEYDEDIEVLEDEFLDKIRECYKLQLKNEYEYLTSDEAIKGTIEINDYYFTKDGNIINESF